MKIDIWSLEARKDHVSLESAEEISAVAKILANSVAASAYAPTSSEAQQLLFAIQCNAHQVLDDESRAIGLGLFPLTSMMNHSCSPNCSHYFEIRQCQPPRLIMVALQDIMAGEELTYSYVPLYQSTAKRREQLQKAYGFVCQCERCLAQPCADVVPISYQSGGELISAESVKPTVRSEEEKYPADHMIDEPTDHVCAPPTQLLLALEAAERGAAVRTQEELRRVYSSLLHCLCHGDGWEIFSADVSCKLMLRTYCTLANAAQMLVEQSTEEEQEEEAGLSARGQRAEWCCACVGFGLLALGCVYHYTRTAQLEAGDLEHTIAVGLAGLSGECFDFCPRGEDRLTLLFDDDVVTVGYTCLRRVGLGDLLSERNVDQIDLSLRMAGWRARRFQVNSSSCDNIELLLAKCFAASAVDTTTTCRGLGSSVTQRRVVKLQQLLPSGINNSAASSENEA